MTNFIRLKLDNDNTNNKVRKKLNVIVENVLKYLYGESLWFVSVSLGLSNQGKGKWFDLISNNVTAVRLEFMC